MTPSLFKVGLEKSLNLRNRSFFGSLLHKCTGHVQVVVDAHDCQPFREALIGNVSSWTTNIVADPHPQRLFASHERQAAGQLFDHLPRRGADLLVVNFACKVFLDQLRSRYRSDRDGPLDHWGNDFFDSLGEGFINNCADKFRLLRWWILDPIFQLWQT